MNPFARWTAPAFIIWRGSDKSPIDPLHAQPESDFARSNAQNPATWLSWETATAYAQSLGAGYGVGVVIHEGCGLLCVDVDHCIADGMISAFAVDMIRQARAQCPDVYVEFSMSGSGVHIIGPFSGLPPEHRNKNKELACELYTSARYIALTGNLLGAL